MAGMADATFTAVDLSRLPAPDIIEALDDPCRCRRADARRDGQSGLTFETRDSDPATKLLQVFAYYAQLLRQRINDAARASCRPMPSRPISTISPPCSASPA
jgi:phage-related baseplate assembly protein